MAHDEIRGFGRFVALDHPAVLSAGVLLRRSRIDGRVEVGYVRTTAPGAGSAIPGSSWTAPRDAPCPIDAMALMVEQFRTTFPHAPALPSLGPSLRTATLDGQQVALDAAVVHAERFAACFRIGASIVTTALSLRIGGSEALAFSSVDPSAAPHAHAGRPPGRR